MKVGEALHIFGNECIHQIEVKVVLQLRSVQDFERNFGDLARSLSRAPETNCKLQRNT